MNSLRSILAGLILAGSALAADKLSVTYEGKAGPGKGRSVVLLSGDEEYRSEEAMPQLAEILAERLGFQTTVLFSIDPATGEIDPQNTKNIPGMEALDHADGCVMLMRFRELPDEQMKHFADYLQAGKPLVALRTSTHAFNYAPESTSPYRNFGWKSTDWPGGFGKQVLGETWVNHWGKHKQQATRGVIELDARLHPIMRGVSGIFATEDVYEAHLPPEAEVLLSGEVVNGMKPTDPPAEDKNSPMMPIAWTHDWKAESGKTVKTFTTTLGAANDLVNEGLRRMIVNAVLWTQGLEVPEKTNVDLVGDFQPSPFGFKEHQKGVHPANLQ